MADFMSPPSGLYRRVMILIIICSGRPTITCIVFLIFPHILPIALVFGVFVCHVSPVTNDLGMKTS